MILTVNGSRRDIEEGTTLQALMRAELGASRGGAAALDGEVVPRSQWPTTSLCEGCAVEIVTAVQGG